MGQMNPLNALNPQVNIYHPLNPGAQPPVMQPGGGTTGAPLQGGVPMQPGGFHNAMMDWRGMRPDRGIPDWRSALMDWRGQRPMHADFQHPQFGQQGFQFGQHNQAFSPQPMPPQGIAVGEQYPGAMPINPAA